MSNHRWATAFRKIRYKLGGVWYRLGCTVKAALSLVLVNRENFIAHLNGPKMRDSQDCFFSWLKWEHKSGHTLDPREVREKLASILEDHDVNW
jgi:hypothetical protein